MEKSVLKPKIELFSSLSLFRFAHFASYSSEKKCNFPKKKLG